MVNIEKKSLIIDGVEFNRKFGISSNIYQKIQDEIQYYYENNILSLNYFEKWKKYYKNIYDESILKKGLFFNLTYLTLIMKILIYTHYTKDIHKVFSLKSFNKVAKDLLKKNVTLLIDDFYSWAFKLSFIRNDLTSILSKITFAKDDIFKLLYQELTSINIRHSKGEYYSPSHLANKMITDKYEMGNWTLDPSCGSGTFIIETFNHIFDINDNKFHSSINNICGIDINPIAVMTSITNALIYLSNYKDKPFRINIFLLDAIMPIQITKYFDINFGSSYKFNNIIISEELLKSKNIKYFEKFIDNIIYDNKWDIENKKEYRKMIGSNNKTMYDNISVIKDYLFKVYHDDGLCYYMYALKNSIQALKLSGRINLLIGNPPWLIYKNTTTIYQDNMRNLAKSLQILPDRKNLPSLDLANIFMYQTLKLYANKHSKIFFIIPKSLLDGGQNNYVRNFHNLINLEIWTFDTMIFPIPSLCIYGEFNNKKISIKKKYPILSRYFEVTSEVKEKRKCKYVPSRLIQVNKFHTKIYSVDKLVLESDNDHVYAKRESPYNKLVKIGAHIIPRSYLFINIIEDLGENVRIESNKKECNRSKDLFKKPPYKESIIEKENIYKTFRTSELYAFYQPKYSNIFLPVIEKNGRYIFNCKKNALHHFQLLNKAYLGKQKLNTHINGYYDRIRENGNLEHPNQFSKYKVVYNSSGRVIRSTIITDKRVIIDSGCAYVSVNNIKEANYLCSILNASITTEYVNKIQSQRHINYLPFQLRIPKFDYNNKNHKKLSLLSLQCRLKMQSINKKLLTRQKIAIYLEKELIKINDIVKNILNTPLQEDKSSIMNWM